MRGLFAIVVVLTGCEKKAPRYEGPLRVDFGDCATDTAWVSGPRPLPIDKRVAKGEKPDPDQGGESGAFASLTGTGDIGGDDIYGGLLGNEPGTGTIGTGRYGTIGENRRGYGIGSPNGMRGRDRAVPTVRIGQPTVQGDLDKAIIRRYIKRNIQKIQYCYEKELLAKPKLEGTLSVQFLIEPTGRVGTSKASGVDPKVSECVAGVIKNIEFPKPKGGAGVQVTYPFVFHPVGDMTPPRNARDVAIADAQAVGTGSGSGSGSGEPPKPEPKVKPKGALGQGPYKPGANNPLVAHRDAIEECLRTSAKPYGALVVQLDWTNNLAKSTVHGAEGRVAECVSDALKSLTRATGSDASQTCSLSFGIMPPADLPGVDITDSITYGGVSIATTKAVVDDTTPTFKIDALFAKVDADVKRDLAVTAPITVIGPLVVRPLDATPIAVVNKVTNTLLAAGGNHVFAANRDGTWHLLKEIAVPVVPVPKGTGGAWSHPTFRRQPALGTDEDRVHLSILVQKDKTWIGLSRVNEFQEIPGGDLAKLKATLSTQKHSAFFADRTDLEIAGELVTYGDVVKVIQAVREVGFVDWKLTDPAGLAARPTL